MDDKQVINTQKEFDELLQTRGPNSLSFPNYVFACDILVNTAIGSPVDFDRSILKGNFTFSSICERNASFSGAVFEKAAKFDNSHFKKKVRFHATQFQGSVTFNNTRFEDLVDFWAAFFFRKTIFLKTDFFGKVVFSATTFHENVLFTYTMVTGLMIFRHTKFVKGLDLSLAIQRDALSLFALRLDDYITVPDPIKEEEFENYVSHEAQIPQRNKRETFRILRRELQSQGNPYDALTFQSLEINSYMKELRSSLKSQITWNKIESYSIFWLNRISNLNGTSWVRGLIFTVAVGYFFFYIAFINTNNYSIGLGSVEDFQQCAKQFCIFLLPTHETTYLDQFGPSASTYVWDFIGRALVGYGIYQTIQAFRRYRKS